MSPPCPSLPLSSSRVSSSARSSSRSPTTSISTTTRNSTNNYKEDNDDASVFFSHNSLLNSVSKKLIAQNPTFTPKKLEKIWILFCESIREDFVRNLKKIYQRSTNSNSSSSSYRTVILAVQIPEIGEFQVTIESNRVTKERYFSSASRSRSTSSRSRAERTKRQRSPSPLLSSSLSQISMVSGTFLPLRSIIHASTIPQSSSNNKNNNNSNKVNIQNRTEARHEENEAARAVVEAHRSPKYLPISSNNDKNRFLRNPVDASSSVANKNIRSRSNSPVVRDESLNSSNGSPSSVNNSTISCSSNFNFSKFAQVVETIFMFSSNHDNDSSSSQSTSRSTTSNIHNSSNHRLVKQAVKLCFLLGAQQCADEKEGPPRGIMTSDGYTLDLMPVGSLSLLHGCRRCLFRVSKEFGEELSSMKEEMEAKSLKNDLEEEMSHARMRSEDFQRSVSRNDDSNSRTDNNKNHLLLFETDNEGNRKINSRRSSSSSASASPQPQPRTTKNVPPLRALPNSPASSFNKPPLLSRLEMLQKATTRLLSSTTSSQHRSSNDNKSSSSSSSLAIKSSSRPSL